MRPSAQIPQILITGTGSYLGVSIAKTLLAQNCQIIGVGSSPLTTPLLTNKNFTLVEVDLAQPLPAYLPKIDLFLYLTSIPEGESKLTPSPKNFSPALSHLISQALDFQSRVAIFVPISPDLSIYESLFENKDYARLIQLFCVGDLYGPQMPLSSKQLQSQRTHLSDLLIQAIQNDKVILENEGQDLLYPAYIADVTFAASKLLFSPDTKNIHFLVSENPTTTLSAAYQIQNAARLTLNKELNLFFAPDSKIIYQPEVVVKYHDLGFAPKVHLAEGLKQTFTYFAQGFQNQKQPLPHRPAISLAQLPATEKPSLLIKFPSFNFNFRLKKILLILAVASLLVITKITFDLAVGAINLQNVYKSLQVADYQKAQQQTRRARSSLQAAQKELKLALYPISLIPKSPAADILSTLEALSLASAATEHFAQGSQVLTDDIAQIVSSGISKQDRESPAANFKKAAVQSSLARSTLDSVQLPSISKVNLLKKNLAQLNQLATTAYDLSNLIAQIVPQDPTQYLVLLQNNTELRPGGGFIGNFAEISFKVGKLENITVEDIYTIDGQLKEKIEPPRQLKEKLGVANLYLRDSNWSADATLNAQTARDFYKKETGKDIAGLIFVDLTFVQNLLQKLGPVKLTDYNEQITADNLFEKGEYYSEIGFFPGSTQKRDFFGALTRTILTNLINDLKSPTKAIAYPDLFATFKDGLAQKHLILSFDNPILSSYVASHGWDHPLPPIYASPADDSYQTRDFLALSEANLGANKVNRALERKISYEMTIGRDADLVGKLTITYTNNSQAETWPAGKYINFLRVYVPFAASLFEYKQSLRSSDDPAGLQNGDKTDLKDVEVTTQGPLTVFATYVEVPIKSQKQVSFTYRIPKNIKLEKAPTYHLYVVKQPGTDQDPFEFKFNLPGYLQVKSVNKDQSQSDSQNLNIKTDLATDRQFEIEVVKK